MEKYKICPSCGEKNKPIMLECIKCGMDITNIPVGEDNENTVAKPESNESGVKMVRVCECGTKNLASARKCSNCGEDISDIIPSVDSEEEIIHYILSTLDGSYAYELTTNLTVVGRENCMKEYLAKKNFVSRDQAEILIEVDKIWIKNHSKTNPTFLNNEVVGNDKYTELHDGDVIGFGGKEINGTYQDSAAYFLVRIGACI